MKISAIIIVMLVISASSVYTFPMETLSDSHVGEEANRRRGEEVRGKECLVLVFFRVFVSLFYFILFY